MRATAHVVGMDDGSLCDDIAHALAEVLPWGKVGATIFPFTSLPLDLPGSEEAQIEVGSLIVSLDPNQGSPEYSDGSGEPDTSPVRLLLEQPVSHDVADRRLLITRRGEVQTAFSGLSGTVGA